MTEPPYLAIFFGLSAGLCWGTADFFGGLQARRLPAASVAFWSHLAGGVAIILLVAVRREAPPSAAILWGIAAGVSGGLGLALFYRGLAEGAMSIVAPIAACGAALPVLAALLFGEPPNPLATVGIVVALLGTVLVSRPAKGIHHPAGRPGQVIALSVGAALTFGLFFILVDRGARAGADPLWITAGARVGSVSILLILHVARRARPAWPGRCLPAIAAIGVADTSANVLFATATTFGNLGVVAVLGSVYPIVTVLLAHFVLAEHLPRLQVAGVALALAGVVLMAAG